MGVEIERKFLVQDRSVLAGSAGAPYQQGYLSVDPERTGFRIGSTSKLFTWTAVMQLVEQVKIDLDADVNQYLDFKIPGREGKPVTMRNIMTHTTGFEESLKSLIETDPSRLLTLDAIVKRWTPERIFPAGSTPAYSNYATALAGYIVARVSGESYEDYVDRHIFAPLGMEHSSFRQPLPKALQPDMSKGYALASQPEPEKPYELIAVAPAGALASTGADMARFMIAHLQNGAFGANRILKTETAQLMHTTALMPSESYFAPQPPPGKPIDPAKKRPVCGFTPKRRDEFKSA